MKRKIFLVSILLCVSLIIFGCNKISKTDNTENMSDDYNSSKSDVTLNVVNNDYESSNKVSNSSEILKSITERGKSGMILNVDFKANENSFDVVETHWGKGDKREFVEEAKGSYVTYLDKNTIFGLNKGEQIFEIRSFSQKIKGISLEDIINFYGEPEYNALMKNDERIVGYSISKDFKLEFVLKNSRGKNNEQFVEHYGIFYPKGTVNNMSGDKGREW